MSRPLTCARSGLWVCVCVGVCEVNKKKKTSSHSLTTYWAVTVQFLLPPSPPTLFLSTEILEEANGIAHVLFLLERKRGWLMLFFRKHHQRKTHQVKVSHIFLPIFFFLKVELALKTGFSSEETKRALTNWQGKMSRSELTPAVLSPPRPWWDSGRFSINGESFRREWGASLSRRMRSMLHLPL